MNAFGNGAAAPFLLLYLHDVRGIALPIVGLASAVGASCALTATLVAGGLAHRLGPRATMVGGLWCSAVAYCLYPLVRQAWHAVALAVLAGAGIGTWLTMQSTLIAALTPTAVRHLAFAWQRVAANVGLGLGGFVGGLIVTTDHPRSFTVLFGLNAITFVVYLAVLLRIDVGPVEPRAVAAARGYRLVWSDRTFRRFAVLNFTVVAAAISLLNALLPVYAKNQAGVAEAVIGGLFLVNCLAVIVAQVPVARSVEGRPRMRALGLMGLLFSAAWLLVAAAGVVGRPAGAIAVLAVAILVFSIAECLYDAVQGALVADLAPDGLLGRYLAVTAFSWQLGFIVGPAAGATLLAVGPQLLWILAASVCAAGAGYSIWLDRRLPVHARLTPRRVAAEAAVDTG